MKTKRDVFRAHGVLLLPLCAMFTGAGWSQISIHGVANAASFEPGLPSGGSLASACVLGLTGPRGTISAASASPLPFVLAGVQVKVNGALAPILSVTIKTPPLPCDQINFQVPHERNATLQPDTTDIGGKLTVSQGSFSDTLTPTPLPAWVGFFRDADGYAIAQHASDYSLVSKSNPATAGETVVVYTTGFTTWPPPPIGFPTPNQPLFSHDFSQGSNDPLLFLEAGYSARGFASTPSVLIEFEGLVPGSIGVFQINFQVPASSGTGDLYLFFNRGSCAIGGKCFITSSSSAPVKLTVH
jgi:uncharacterized protein (TIGR03437 family)